MSVTEIHLGRPLHFDNVAPAAMSPSSRRWGRIIVVRDVSRSMSARRSLVPRHRGFRLSRVVGEFNQPVEQECAHYATDNDARDCTTTHTLAGATIATGVAAVLAGLKTGFCVGGWEFLGYRNISMRDVLVVTAWEFTILVSSALTYSINSDPWNEAGQNRGNAKRVGYHRTKERSDSTPESACRLSLCCLSSVTGGSM